MRTIAPAWIVPPLATAVVVLAHPVTGRMRRLRLVFRKHEPRDASGHRLLQLREAAFNGWTGQGEGSESFPLGTRRAIRPCAGSTVPRRKVAAVERCERAPSPKARRRNMRTDLVAPRGAPLPLFSHRARTAARRAKRKGLD